MLARALRSIRPPLPALASPWHVLPARPQMDSSCTGPVERAIWTKLLQALEPELMEVVNESHMHAVAPGSESHFRVLVVSSRFEGLSLLQRHRLVNEALREELASQVHALAIQTKTPQQWQSNPTLAKSPPCMGGSKHDSAMATKRKVAQE